MTTYERALKFTLKWEGGYSDHPNDPGGATMQGITQRTYDAYRKRKGLATRGVHALSKPELAEIYRGSYWNAVQGDALTEKLAVVMFDVAVNHGPGRARQWLTAAKATMDDDPTNDDLELARRIIDMRVNFYYGLAKRRPAMKVFLKGWLNRARALKREIGC